MENIEVAKIDYPASKVMKCIYDYREMHLPSIHRAQIIGVASATAGDHYSQHDLLDRYQVGDRRVRAVYTNGGIRRRFLSLPESDSDGKPAAESQSQLLSKHRKVSLAIGSSALRRCLERAALSVQDIDYLCVVTTTGFLVPGLSALLIKELGLKCGTSRVDIVGMGCNAGLNGLNVIAGWASVNPGKVAVMLCVEICSAAYVYDGSMQNAVVNSLFGDGAAAVALRASPNPASDAPFVDSFASCVIVDAVDSMRFDWDDSHGKFSFSLDQEVPYVVGANAEDVVDRLLRPHRLRRSDIAHWIVHSGGKKVIDSVKINLGLTAHELRHTTDVLRDFGNVSSGSFLFSYERLIAEGSVCPGDRAVMMTMGPGSTIETALLHWPEIS